MSLVEFKIKKVKSVQKLTLLFLCLMFATNFCCANFQTSPKNRTASVAVEAAQANSNTRTNILALLELPATPFPRRSGDQLMAETNTIGNSLSQVTRVGSLLLGEVRGGVAQHLHQDAFNSVMVTSLADGTIPGRLSYRAFGRVRTSTGNVATPFRFNGYIDDGNGELSSPARYYATALGRFTGMDPAAMDPMNPITGNPYVGLNANPMVIIDPTGKYGVFFDGTNNDGRKPAYGEKTNVWKLSKSYASGPAKYINGVGTEFGDGGHVLGLASGMGFNDRVERGYEALVDFYNQPSSREMRINNPKEWARVSKIDVFGFSRGAAQGRVFANILKSRGIPDKTRPMWGDGYNINYENFDDVNIRFMGLFDTVDGRGVQLLNPDSAGLAIDPDFVGTTVHLISVHERRPGFDSTSILPYDGAQIANMFEYYSPGAHSDGGGSQPQKEFMERGRYRLDELQDSNLAIMRYKAAQAGIPLLPVNEQDKFTLDPRSLTDQELWNDYIHDSRLYPSTYLIPETIRRLYRASTWSGNPLETYDRRERDIYFTGGTHKVFSEKELERRWRKYNGYDLIIEEKDDSL